MSHVSGRRYLSACQDAICFARNLPWSRRHNDWYSMSGSSGSGFVLFKNWHRDDFQRSATKVRLIDTSGERRSGPILLVDDHPHRRALIGRGLLRRNEPSFARVVDSVGCVLRRCIRSSPNGVPSTLMNVRALASSHSSQTLALHLSLVTLTAISGE